MDKEFSVSATLSSPLGAPLLFNLNAVSARNKEKRRQEKAMKEEQSRQTAQGLSKTSIMQSLKGWTKR
jgi:hypothetical protein